jgi:hypothetical protein
VLNYVALFVIAFLLVMVAAAIVWIGSLPGKIAHRRGHPQPDAVNAASWISFLTLGALWPLAFVWAFIRTEDSPAEPPAKAMADTELEKLQSRLVALEATVRKLQPKA